MFMPVVAGLGDYSAELTALIAQMTSAPTEARARIYDNKIIRPLKQAGIWAKLDAFYVCASHHSQAATLNWKAPTTFALTAGGAPTFTTDRGFTYDGVDDYHNTGYRWETAGLNGSLNSHFFAAWNRRNVVSDGSAIGAWISGNSTAILRLRMTGDIFRIRINDTTSFNNTNTDARGFYAASRIASNDKRAFKDGSQVGATQTTASTTGPDASYYIGADNQLGTAVNFANCEIAFAAFGGGLSTTEMTDLYNAVSSYMTAVGA